MDLKKGLTYVSFGILFTLADFYLSIGNFQINIFPDFIGWILLYLAFDKFGEYTEEYGTPIKMPAFTVEKEADKRYTYTRETTVGWVSGANYEVVENKTFVNEFKAVPIDYTVTFKVKDINGEYTTVATKKVNLDENLQAVVSTSEVITAEVLANNNYKHLQK